MRLFNSHPQIFFLSYWEAYARMLSNSSLYVHFDKFILLPLVCIFFFFLKVGNHTFTHTTNPNPLSLAPQPEIDPHYFCGREVSRSPNEISLPYVQFLVSNLYNQFQVVNIETLSLSLSLNIFYFFSAGFIEKMNGVQRIIDCIFSFIFLCL